VGGGCRRWEELPAAGTGFQEAGGGCEQRGEVARGGDGG
jgi:hypothetical protein